MTEKATMRNLFEIYCDSQQFRMRTVSRLKKASNDGSFQGVGEEVIEGYLALEHVIAKRLKSQMKGHPMSQWLYANYGIGPILAAGLIAYIDDIERFGTVSKLWKYSGMGTTQICEDCKKRIIEDGARGAWIMHTADRLEEQNSKKKDQKKKVKREELIIRATDMVCLCPHPHGKTIAQRKITGQMLDYNPKFKNLCYLIGDQFIKQLKSPYRKLYDEYKLDYSTRPDLMAEIEERKRAPKNEDDKHIVKGTAHVNAMARRKATKLFLSHLWETWRTLEGLPTPEPYAIGILGHVDKIAPFVTLEQAGYEKLENGKYMHKKVHNTVPDDMVDEDFTSSLSS